MLFMKRVTLKTILLLMIVQLFYGFLFSVSVPEKAQAGGGPTNFPFGVNAHIVQRYYGDKNTAFTKMTDLGMDAAREEFSWTSIESSNDSWNYSNYDQIVTDYNSNNIEMLGLLVKSPSWSNGGRNNTYVPNNNGSDNNLDEWYEFVRTTVERYDGDGNADAPGSPIVIDWELWNEPNHDYYFNVTSHDRDYWYAKMLKRGYQAVQDAVLGSPIELHAKVVFGGTSGADNTFIYDVVNNNGGTPYCDVFAVHPYRSHNKIETYVNFEDSLQYQIGRVVAMAKKYGDKPIWLTEIGWRTDVVSEQTQADYLTRTMLAVFSNESVERVYVYDLKDAGDGPWGLMDSSWTEKTSYDAYKTIVSKLDTPPISTALVERKEVASRSVIDNAESGLKWSYSKFNSGGNVSLSSTKKSGSKSVFVEYNNNFADNAYGRMIPSSTINLGDCNGYCPIFGMWVKGTNDFNMILRAWIKDATGETFQVNISRSPYSGWQYVTVNLNDPGHKVSHWGGDNDGQFDGNLRLDSIIVAKNYEDSTSCSGYFFLDDIKTWKDSAFKHHYTFNKGYEILDIVWSAYGTNSADINLGYDEITKTTQTGVDSQVAGTNGSISHTFTENLVYYQPRYASKFFGKYNVTNPGEDVIIMAAGDTVQVQMDFINTGTEILYGQGSASDPKAILSTDNSLGRSSIFDDGTWYAADTQPSMVTDTQTLNSGDITTISFNLKAPLGTGSSYYKEQFRLIAEGVSDMNSNPDAYFEVLVMPTVASAAELRDYMDPATNPSDWDFWWDYAIRYDNTLLSWFFDDLVVNDSVIRSMFWDSAVPYKWTSGYYHSRLWDSAVPHKWSGGHYLSTLFDSAIPYKWAGGYYFSTFWDKAVRQKWASKYYLTTFWDKLVPYKWGNKHYFSTFWDKAVPNKWAGSYYNSSFWNSAVPGNWSGAYYRNTLNGSARPQSWAGGYYR